MGQGFAYDGFGNLTAKSALSGTPPVGSDPADAYNRLAGVAYDSNGNELAANGSTLAYDVSNRMILSTGSSLQGLYEYDAGNKRVMQVRQHYNGSNLVTDSTEFYFYGITGQKVGTYFATVSGTGASMVWGAGASQVFFGSKLISRSSGAAQEDVRGSVGSYYPYGEDRTSTANDTVKFATYTRDLSSGLDYAANRYFSNSPSRFLTPDPYRASSATSNPVSWNHFSYVQGDPINYTDPDGLDVCIDIPGIGRVCFADPQSVTVTTDPLLLGIQGPNTKRQQSVDRENKIDAKEQALEGARKADLEFSCNKDVRDAMKKAWAQSSNGNSGVEAGFRIDSTSDGYQIVPNGFTNEQGRQTLTIDPNSTWAIFHVHPNNSGPQPSTPETSVNHQGDTTLANKYSDYVYVMSSRGLWVYDPYMKKSFQLQSGLDWTKPCPEGILP